MQRTIGIRELKGRLSQVVVYAESSAVLSWLLGGASQQSVVGELAAGIAW